MKKALILLLILAVAGGLVFAQAPAFSIGGEARAATVIDFAPASGSSGNLVRVDEDTYGLVKFGWDLNGYNVGFDFKVNPLDGTFPTTIGLFGEYAGDDYGFKAAFPIIRSDGAAGIASNVTFGIAEPDALWGYWYLFNDMLLLDVAYMGGRDDALWAVSDLVGGNIGNFDSNPRLGGRGIRVNFQGVPGLNVGMILGQEVWGTNDVVNVFKNMGVGVNYDLGFMALSLEFALNNQHPNLASKDDVDAEVFLGSKFNFGLLSLKADLALVGLGLFGDYGMVHLGIGVEFASGPLTVGLNLRARDIMDNVTIAGPAFLARYGGDIYGDYDGGRMITVDPYVNFVISDYLWAGLRIGFYVGLGEEEILLGGTKNEIGVAFEPKLAYFFKGGADGDDPGNGIVFSYLLGYDIGNAGDIIDNYFKVSFRWNF